jgi:hypothetical protein
MQNLLNFDVAIDSIGGDYRTRVIDSPAGQAYTDFAVPFSDKDLRILVLEIMRSVGQARRRVRALGSQDRGLLENFGGQLFQTAFSGPVRECLRRSLDAAESSSNGLRIRLRLPQELTNIPWEYLYDREYGFIGLSPETAFVRYVEIPTPVRPFPISPPLRILAMISAPSDIEELQSEEEWSKLNEALSDLISRDMVQVDRLPTGTLAALQRPLRLHEYHVLHFIGHGGWDEDVQDGALALEGANGKIRLVSGRHLGMMLRGHRSLRMVVLNACEGARSAKDDPFGGVAQALVRQGIPAVIAMQFEITDLASLVFSQAFYEAIADDLAIDIAMVEARKAMFAEGHEVEWATPVLYLRAPNGRVFTRDRVAEAEQKAREEAEQKARQEAERLLSVQPLEPEKIAEMIIDDFGEPTVQATAAMLLSGPVSITASEGTTLDDRRHFLEAVAALLPYGPPSAYMPATWPDSGLRHPGRLTFVARPGTELIRWRSAPTSVPEGPANIYLRLLQQIRARLSEPRHLAALIRFMQADDKACSFDQPQHAIDRLREFARLYAVLEEARAGTARPQDIRLTFRRSQTDGLTPVEQQELLAGLICMAGQDPQNWEVIDSQWDTVTGGEPLTMLPALVEGSRRLVWTQAPDRLTCQRYLDCAARHGIIDDLLAQLVAVPDSRANLVDGRQTAARLVADSMLTVDVSALPQTRVALVGSPLIACELLTNLAGDGQDLEPALAWLQPVMGGVLAPFSTIMGRAPGQVSQQAIGQLADHDVEYVSALLVAAHSLRRLELVLPGFASWLGYGVLRRGAPDPAWGQYWSDRVMAIQHPPADVAAWLDLVLLILGKRLRFLLARTDQQTRKLYTDSFIIGWVALDDSLRRPGDDLLTHNLTVYLRQERWAADAATATGVTDLVRPLTRDGQRPGLRATVSDALERSPEAIRSSFVREWLSRGSVGRRTSK